jgi:hypothetical protein
MGKGALSSLEVIDPGNIDHRSNCEPELGPTEQLAGFFDLLDGDSHLPSSSMMCAPGSEHGS